MYSLFQPRLAENGDASAAHVKSMLAAIAVKSIL
jgi:hypothetical protein